MRVHSAASGSIPGENDPAAVRSPDEPYPRDREFWAITADETVERLTYWPSGSAWARAPLFSCVDDEKAAYAADDLFEWSDSPEPLRAHQGAAA